MKTRQYVLYRHGSNGANQSLCDKRAVAIVEAESRQAACAEVIVGRTLAIDEPGRSALAPWVDRWANQSLSATAVSRAPRRDVDLARRETEAAQEGEAFWDAEVAYWTPARIAEVAAEAAGLPRK